MTAKALLDRLTQAGCRVTLTGDQIKITGRLTDEQREFIRENKPELVEYLKRQAFVQSLCRQMDATGTASFHSKLLNETVYVVRSWDSLPSLPEGALVLSMVELQNMMAQTYSDSELRELVAAKREILAAHRQSLADPQATVEDALRIFPGSRVVDATAANQGD